MYVKALTSRNPGQLSILGCPYGGHLDGKDGHKQFFSPDTYFYEDVAPAPPIFYWHGALTNSTVMPIGKVEETWRDSTGLNYRAQLNMDMPEAQKTWAAALQNNAYASSGPVPASVTINDETGEIISWLVAELSVFDLDRTKGRIPINFYAVAAPRIKSLTAQLLLPHTGTGELPGVYQLKQEFLRRLKMDNFEKLMTALQSVLASFASTAAAEAPPEGTTPPMVEKAEEMCPCTGRPKSEGCNCPDASVMAHIPPITPPVEKAEEPSEIETLRAQVKALQLDATARDHAEWVNQMIAEGRVVQAEKATVISSLAQIYNAGGPAAASVFMKAYAARPKAVIAKTPVVSGASVMGFGTQEVGEGSVDPAYLKKMRGYAGIPAVATAN